jgi:hypothetical protein
MNGMSKRASHFPCTQSIAHRRTVGLLVRCSKDTHNPAFAAAKKRSSEVLDIFNKHVRPLGKDVLKSISKYAKEDVESIKESIENFAKFSDDAGDTSNDAYEDNGRRKWTPSDTSIDTSMATPTNTIEEQTDL